MTSMPNWASQPHIPVEDYQGQGNHKRGRRGEQVSDQRMQTEIIMLSNKRAIADSNLPKFLGFPRIYDSERALNTPFPHHHSTHAKCTHTSATNPPARQFNTQQFIMTPLRGGIAHGPNFESAISYPSRDNTCLGSTMVVWFHCSQLQFQGN